MSPLYIATALLDGCAPYYTENTHYASHGEFPRPLEKIGSWIQARGGNHKPATVLDAAVFDCRRRLMRST